MVAKGIQSQDIAKEMAKLLNGSGGGRPEFAQGGSKDKSRLPEALEKIVKVIKEKIV
jgi:alanyl-tRNA synthetase